MNQNVYAVILAGGTGTRFWPLSRTELPKQFLDVTGKGCLLVETISRITPTIKNKNIFIITNKKYQRRIHQLVKPFDIPGENILFEPEGKNTAPAVCWSAAAIQRINPNAIMAVLPSDHLILKKNNYLKILKRAFQLAQEDHLVTLGISPTRPETGFGYLKTSKSRIKAKLVIKVDQFTEKPDISRARQFIKKRNYYWNSGMFIWKTAVILKEFKKYLPEVYDLIGKNPGNQHIRKVWSRLPSISIDYGILEKASDVACVPTGDIGWSDLGSWESLFEVLARDKNHNILKGDVISLDCADTLIWGRGRRLIAAMGLEGMIIVDTPDALLICPKSRAQGIRDIVSILKNKNRPELVR